MKPILFYKMNSYDHLIIVTHFTKKEENGHTPQKLYEYVSKEYKKIYPLKGEPPSKNYFYQRINFLETCEVLQKIGKPYVIQFSSSHEKRLNSYVIASKDMMSE